MRFREAFEKLTGFTPMNWQERLYREYFSKGVIPASLDIPTGLGKTSVMAIWYLARKAGASLSRRMVYVVDRRAVVDQATTIASQIKERADDSDLRISTLRGQYVDNRVWLEDPGKLAIVVGTVDMIGSRLLFSGYGVSRKTRSYHAGLLGADTLVVLDESHLVPPFERLLEAIDSGVETFGAPVEFDRGIIPCFRLLSLSATGQKREGESFNLNEDKGDLDDMVVKVRLNAKKHLTVGSCNDRKLEEALAESAWCLAGDGAQPVRILVYCDSRDMADKTKQAIEAKAKKEKIKIRTELFVGARRVKERMDASDWLEKFGFLAKSNSKPDRPTFLVATSAGEVGVDLDADHMVCDLVAWERMVQRLGRVNRLGKDRQAEINIVTEEPKKPDIEKPKSPPSNPPKEPKKPGRLPRGSTEAQRADHADKKARYEKENKEYSEQKKKFDKLVKEYPGKLKKYQTAWKDYWIYEARLAAMNELSNDASPGALLALKRRAQSQPTLAERLEKASTPPPLYPALTRALVDAWSMTSLEMHTGRPEIAPWLRGWVDKEGPQTAIIWRKYLPVRKDGPSPAKKDIEAFFEAAPPHLSEKLESETWRVASWLEKRAAARNNSEGNLGGSIVAFALDPDGGLRKSFCASELMKDDDNKREKERKDALEDSLAGATLTVDGRLAGLTDDGLLNDAALEIPRTADDGDAWPVDVGFRFYASTDDAPDRRALVTHSFATRQSSEGEDVERLLIVTTRTEDSRAASTNPQLLDEHQTWAADRAEKIADAVGLEGNYKTALVTAARLHDNGKRAARWQRAFNARHDGVYAKTTGPLVIARLGDYRHEFGSLPYAENDTGLQKLPKCLRDLVLHLIASHHGRARPVIGTEGCEAPPSVLEGRAREVALRFARLQKQWGPWGLSWWEALLRAADQQASRENDNRSGSHG